MMVGHTKGVRVMKLTYWYAQCLTDSDVYSIRERTKKEAKAKMASLTPQQAEDHFAPLKKVTIEYDDGFELMWQCAGENRFYWEA